MDKKNQTICNKCNKVAKGGRRCEHCGNDLPWCKTLTMRDRESCNYERRLFLASWFAGSATLLPDFASEDLTGKKVVFIPTAIMYEMSDDERAVYNYINGLDKAALENIGFIVEELEVSTASVVVPSLLCKS